MLRLVFPHPQDDPKFPFLRDPQDDPKSRHLKLEDESNLGTLEPWNLGTLGCGNTSLICLRKLQIEYFYE